MPSPAEFQVATVAAEFTVNMAAVVVSVPAVLLKTASYWQPFKSAVAPLMVSIVVVTPL